MTKIFAVAIAVILIAIPAMAEAKIAAKIPFEFHAGDTTLPAGEYVIEVLSALNIRVTNKDTGEAAVVQTPIPISEAAPLRSAKLVFSRYGSEYFLAEAWWAERSNGRAILKTNLEVELAKRIAPVRIESVSARK